MKCKNCNKEILEYSQNFCSNCGETLNKDSNAIKFEDQINTGLTEEQIQSAKEQLGNAKKILVNNKKTVGIIASILAVILIVIGIFGFMSGRAMSENKIKDSLIGESIYIGGENFTITEDNLKNIKVINRNTIKKSSDSLELELELDLKEANATIKYSAKYYYDKEWVFSSGYEGEIVNIDPKTKPEDNVEESLKENGIGFKVGGSVKGEVIKEVTNIKVEGNGQSRTFTADILLSNGVISQKGKVEGDIDFDLSDFTWKTSYVYIVNSDDVKIEEKVDEETLKSILMDIIGGSDDGKSYEYEYMVGEDTRSSSFIITRDIISSLNIKNTSYLEDDKAVRVELEGKATGGLIKELSFSGVVLLNSSFDRSLAKSIDIDITNASVEEIEIEKIKELLLDNRIDNTKITTNVVNTFVEENRNVAEIVREYINGKITINDTEVSVQVQVQLSLKDGKYIWRLNGIYKEGSFGFEKFE